METAEMTRQLQLLDPPRRAADRRGDAPKPADRRTVFERVLAELLSAGARGMTDEQMLDAFVSRGDMRKESTLRARRHELVDAGLAIDSKRSRATRSGVHATVWIAAEFKSDETPEANTPRASKAAIGSREGSRGNPSPTAAMLPPIDDGGKETIRPAALPCRACGSREWRYPAADAAEPCTIVCCAGCGKFVGHARA